LSSPSLLLAQQKTRQVLTDYAIITSRNWWLAAQGPAADEPDEWSDEDIP